MLKDGAILAPLDGSDISERSLHFAAAMAEALNSKLVLMMAAYISGIPEHGPWSASQVSHPRETCEAYLKSVRERIGASAADIVVKVATRRSRSSRLRATWEPL